MSDVLNSFLNKPEILLVDDEPAIIIGLSSQLIARGYTVRTAADGVEAIKAYNEKRPDLIILDLMMPKLDGLEVTHQLRMRLRSEVPIIVLSARGEEQEKVQALDLGADDYLTKPFGLDELMARVRVALRRRNNVNQSQEPAVSKMITDGFLTIDLVKHQVFREGQEVKLTPKQYDLLKYLALNPEKLLTHNMLLQAIWGAGYQQQNQYLHVFINQLRQKLEPNPAKPGYILTEPGLGYRFRLSDNHQS